MMRKNIHPGVMGVLLAGLSGGFAAGIAAQERENNPFTSTQDVQSGQRIFGSQCAVCHGVGAIGGDVGPDLTSGEFKNASTDRGLFNVISEGVPGTAMIGINRNRTDQTVWQLVAYLRAFTGDRVAVEGDAMAGDRFFSAGDCIGCHVVEGVGGRQGPDLSTIGNRRTPVQLMSDLVDPDERVQPRWWTMRVTHLDGTRVEGLRMNEGTYSLRILDADDNLWSLDKKELREIERIETSSMPSYSGLSETQLNDLVAYLYGLTTQDP